MTLNRITLDKLRLALRYGLAVKASVGGGWFIDKPARQAVRT